MNWNFPNALGSANRSSWLLQAVCTITQLLAEKQIPDLRGLLTRRALAQLELEVDTQWGELQRRYIPIEPTNVQIALPRRVHFRTTPNQFYGSEGTVPCKF